MRDPLKASAYETDRPEFVGLTLEGAKEKIKTANLYSYLIWQDGKWDETMRSSQLRPKEVKLVVRDGIVQRAYQIL